MYAVHLIKGVYSENAELTAVVPTYRGACMFVEHFMEMKLAIFHDNSPVGGPMKVEAYACFSDGTVVATIVGPPRPTA